MKYILIIILLLSLGIPAGSTLTFTWNPPTTNTDGSPLTDLRGYRVYEKVGASPWVGRIGVSPRISTIKYKPISTGVHKYRITAINMTKIESLPSNEVEVNLEVPAPVPSQSPAPSSTPR